MNWIELTNTGISYIRHDKRIWGQKQEGNDLNRTEKAKLAEFELVLIKAYKCLSTISQAYLSKLLGGVAPLPLPVLRPCYFMHMEMWQKQYYF